MSVLRYFILLSLLACGYATAADYAVGIVNAGSGLEGAGKALNLYSISNKGVDLVKGSPYFLPPAISGVTYEPIRVAIAPDHDLVYVVYLRVYFDEPILVQFEVTPDGLIYQWTQVLQTGDAGLQGSSIEVVRNYLVENTFPYGHWVTILDRLGHAIVQDAGSDGVNLISGHIDPEGYFYYSCRRLSATGPGTGPADAVAVFRLTTGVTFSTTPLLTSTDPVFVQSICD